jgi:dipeptide ABC superfamily ATP binding cassette transporter, binding protein
MKKRFLLPAVLLMALALGACTNVNKSGGESGGAQSGKEASTDGASEGGITEFVAQIAQPETIDPALNNTNDGANVILHLSEGLLKMGKDGVPVPGLAESYELSDDKLTYTFKLREGLKWSDGSELNANDFVYSWKRVADPVSAAPYAKDLLGQVKGYEEASKGNLDALGVSAPDEHTFVVELENQVPFFDKIVAFLPLVPVQQATVEANGEGWATNPETYISSGPYKMVEYTDGDRIVMEKNPNYWDAENITFDKLTYRMIEDPNSAFTAYNQGEVGMIKSVPSEEIPGLKGKEDFHLEPQMGLYYVTFNTAKAPFDNADVRKAMSLVIDRDYVANTVMQGTYLPAKTIVPPSVSDAQTGTKFADVTLESYTKGVGSGDYEADVKEAQELLAKAGYPNGEGFPTVEYSINDQGYHKPVAEYLQNVWKEKLGINTDISVKEWKVFTADRRNGNFDVARHGWVMDWDDPSNLLNLYRAGSGNNDGKINIEEYDKLMDKSDETADPKERFEYMHEAEKILIDESALAPVAFYTEFYLQDTKLKNTWYSPYGYWFFMYGTLED